MRKKERYLHIIEWFKQNMALVETELNYNNPFELLVAVILSAQCTDKRVNLTTPKLFEQYPDAKSLSEAQFEDVFNIIKSISYPNNKAKHLIAMAKILYEKFNSIVPSEIEELMTMPGVGRKTANVVASIIYNKAVIAVDTHVFRVSRRLGLSSGKTVNQVEKDLEENIAEEYRAIAHHWLILHGRYVCKAIKPLCEECGINIWCKDYLRKELKIARI